jgi:uncharacterized protein with NAD-binding domain and iron-sulfur cluster
VRGAGAGTLALGAAANPLIARAIASARPGRRVAVLGGGMAGLTAAHELAERGFGVDVYEPVALGGKARSIGVRGSGTGGRRNLPGEHGFRFFPGFYHHVPDTMRRIPDGGNANGVWDNLVDTTEGRSVRSNGRVDAQLFGMFPDPVSALSVDGLRALLLEEVVKQKMVPPQESAYLVERLLVFFTSCDERRYGEWEYEPWWDFIGAESRSDEYQKIAARGLTRSLVAAKETVASTRTIGNMAEAFVMNIMGRGNDGALDRVLDRPTNEAWIRPWVAELERLGVRFHMGHRVEELELDGRRIASARAADRHGRRRRIEADWFVSAMPAERIERLLTRRLLRRDPALEGIRDLKTDWMSGIQFFLTKPIDITRGHVTYVDAEWALTSLTQAQFWPERDFARHYGDGRAVDCLSVDVSDWSTPGPLTGKTAKRCTRPEIRREVWHQITEHLKDTDPAILEDGLVHSWFLDPGIKWHAGRGWNSNATPLLVNTAGSWDKRPEARTGIPNLFLCGDYVRNDIDLATMEGANETGRKAVAELLATSGVKGAKAEPPQMYRLYDPPEFEPVKAADRALYEQGRPNALDVA